MSRADRKKRRRERLDAEDRAEFEEAITGVRMIGEDANWRGGGQIVAQIGMFPSFEPGIVWDFRGFESVSTLYVSHTDPTRPGYFKPGYHKVSEAQDVLKPLHEAITEFDIDLRFGGRVGLDGTCYSVRFQSLFNEVSLKWWGRGPDEWKPFIDKVFEVIEALESLTPRTDESEPSP